MAKVDKTVIKETKYISVCILILSALMQAVFLVIRKWDYTVLLGNALSGVFSALNFFLMGLSVQKALGKEEKEAKNTMKVSQAYRNLMLLVVVVIGLVFPAFNRWAVIIPLFFPRIAVSLRPLADKNTDSGGGNS